MRKTFILIRKDTDEPDGLVSVDIQNLQDFDYDHKMHDLMEVPADHPVFREQLNWTAPMRDTLGATMGRQLIRKPQEQIDAEEATRHAQQQPAAKSETEVLLALVNELRIDKGLLPVTIEEVRQRQRYA